MVKGLVKTCRKPSNCLTAFRVALPILAVIVASIAINLRKLGLQELNLPVLAAAVGFGSASAVYLTGLLISFNLRKQFTISIQDIPIFIAGGFSLALGWLCILYALSHGVLRWQNGGSQVVSFCRWVSAFYLVVRSFATTYNLKSTSQKPSKADGPEHPAKNDLGP